MCIQQIIFTDSKGNSYTKNDIINVLKSVGADKCKTLFIHTDVVFGKPNPTLKRKGYLQALYDVLLSLNVDTVIFPAFSYSFCNNEDYDVYSSKTYMGALNEYVRKQPGVIRSLDPLVSFAVIGKDANNFTHTPINSAFGIGSDFDILHNMQDVKFLFFGADFSEYFTYIHHIEKVMNVPYRYDQVFSGYISDYEGNRYYHKHIINTQCAGVELKNYEELKGILVKKNLLNLLDLGDLEVACISESDVYREVTNMIANNPFTFVKPYTKEDLVYEYVFGKNGERVTHC